jgi:hypothetical protein
MNRGMAPFEEGADTDGELLAAVAAMLPASAKSVCSGQGFAAIPEPIGPV